MVAMKQVPKLVDELGTLRAELSKLKKREEELKNLMVEAHEQTGKDRFEGKLFEVLVTKGDRTSIDFEVVKSKLTQKQIAENCIGLNMEGVTKILGSKWVEANTNHNEYYIIRPSVKK